MPETKKPTSVGFFVGCELFTSLLVQQQLVPWLRQRLERQEQLQQQERQERQEQLQQQERQERQQAFRRKQRVTGPTGQQRERCDSFVFPSHLET